MYELDRINEVREKQTLKLERHLSNNERDEIYEKLKFFMKYLHILLVKEPTTKELQKRIRKELNSFQILLKQVMEDEWFVSSLDILLDTSVEASFKKTGKGLAFTLKKSNCLWVVVLFSGVIRFLLALPEHVADRFRVIIDSIRKWVTNIYRKQKLKRKFNYIKNQIRQ